MLIFSDRKFIKTSFKAEEELEQVVVANYEHIFGPSSIYLPKKLIRTADGVGTIPDGFALDLASRNWYIVEAELLHHSVWNHIAPQISKQAIACLQPMSRKIIIDLAVLQYQLDETTKEKFSEQGIKEIDVRKVVGEILEKEPIIGLPIDDISNDLREWARTLRYNVKLWIISKYVEFNNPVNIVYEFPEEFKPEFDTEADESAPAEGAIRYDVKLTDLIDNKLIQTGSKLFMEYKPRTGNKRRYEALVEEDGSLALLGQSFSSPSYAALAGIQDAGSDRKTVNGWTSWKTQEGYLLTELRDIYIKQSNIKQL